MAKQTVNIGSAPNDQTGDPLRIAFDKINDNFDELYPVAPAQDEKDALAGTEGTPSAANPYVTDSDPRLVGGGTYDGASPSTVEVGGAPAGTTLTGKTALALLEEILVKY